MGDLHVRRAEIPFLEGQRARLLLDSPGVVAQLAMRLPEASEHWGMSKALGMRVLLQDREGALREIPLLPVVPQGAVRISKRLE